MPEMAGVATAKVFRSSNPAAFAPGGEGVAGGGGAGGAIHCGSCAAEVVGDEEAFAGGLIG